MGQWADGPMTKSELIRRIAQTQSHLVNRQAGYLAVDGVLRQRRVRIPLTVRSRRDEVDHSVGRVGLDGKLTDMMDRVSILAV